MENTEIAKPKGVDGKIIAGISYFGLIGLIIAFVLSRENKNELVLFHLKQAAGLFVLLIVFHICTSFACAICAIPIFWIGFILVLPVVVIINTCILILMIMGIINGFTEKMKPLPIIGKKSDAFFSKYIK